MTSMLGHGVRRSSRVWFSISSMANSSNTACFFPSISRPATERRSVVWLATTPAARARSATATWCTTCTPSKRWSTAPVTASPRRRVILTASTVRPPMPRLCRTCGHWPHARRTRSRRDFQSCYAASAATTSKPSQPTATTWRTCWSARKARLASSPGWNSTCSRYRCTRCSVSAILLPCTMPWRRPDISLRLAPVRWSLPTGR